MTAANDVFKAILADTSPFIVKGGWFPSNKPILRKFMSVPNGNQILFYFENSCTISLFNEPHIQLYFIKHIYTFFFVKGKDFFYNRSWYWSCDLRFLKLSQRNLGEL